MTTRPIRPVGADRPDVAPGAYDVAAVTFSVGDVLATVWRHRLALIVGALAGATLGLALATRVKDSYTAGASLIWDTSVSRIIDEGTGEASALIDPSATSTIVESLSTPKILERALALLPAEAYDELATESGIADYISASEPGIAAYEGRMMQQYLGHNLSIYNSGRSYVVQVYYTAGDPKTAAMVANMVVDGFLEHRLELKRGLYAQMLDSLDGQIETLKTQLDSADSIAQARREEGRLLALRSESLTGQAQRAAIADGAALFASQREAERQAEAVALVYEKLLRNQRELNSRMLTPELDVQIFAPAVEPIEPSGFNVRPVLPVLGAFGGVLAAASLALLRDRLRAGRRRVGAGKA